MNNVAIQRFTYTDKAGNEVKRLSDGRVFLQLKGEHRSRYIGRLDSMTDGRFKYTKMIYKQHRFKDKRFGLNLSLIEQMDESDLIVVMTPSDIYKISVRDAREKGRIKYFKVKGFEKQLLVKPEDCKKERRP